MDVRCLVDMFPLQPSLRTALLASFRPTRGRGEYPRLAPALIALHSETIYALWLLRCTARFDEDAPANIFSSDEVILKARCRVSAALEILERTRRAEKSRYHP